jgi:hypothetical protein
MAFLTINAHNRVPDVTYLKDIEGGEEQVVEDYS